MITMMRKCDRCGREMIEHLSQGWARCYVEIQPTINQPSESKNFDLCPRCVETSDLTAMLRGASK